MQAITTVGDSTKAQRAGFYSALILIPYGILAALIGVCAAALFPGIKSIQAMPALIVELDPLPIVLALYASDVLAVAFLAKALRAALAVLVLLMFYAPRACGAPRTPTPAAATVVGCGFSLRPIGRIRHLSSPAKHHGIPLGLTPSPSVFIAAAARSTRSYPPGTHHICRLTGPRHLAGQGARWRDAESSRKLWISEHSFTRFTSQSRTSRRRSPATWRPIGVTASPSARESSMMASMGSPPG
ncbi:hypothetical protein [Saccharopolyspora endophytica]|uniref:hypothetical protein n=1 Tax=Saccharopolyspora endophytica TaxID=543886 RepID=UPI001FE6870B|nr:hypothetical protein [Saccharopolyspora endophytica]